MVNFCTPKPDADLCLCVDLPLDKKNFGKSGLGHWDAEPSWAAGHWAFRLLGRHGPRACFWQNPPFWLDFGPKIGGGAYLRDHLFWELLNAWFGSLAIQYFFLSTHFCFTREVTFQ